MSIFGLAVWVEQIVSQLSGIGGRRPMGFGKDRVRSLPDAIAQVLSEHIGLTEPGVQEMQVALGKTTQKVGDMCPDCGSATLSSTKRVARSATLAVSASARGLH